MSSIIDEMKVTGEVTLKQYDEFGNLIHEETVNNMVVTVGKNFIASRLIGTTPSATQMTYMGIGTSTTAAALGDTALGTQSARVALTGSAGTATNNTVTYAASFPAGTATGALTEAGIFNASTAGTMLCRTVFSVINKGANDTLSVTWVLTIS